MIAGATMLDQIQANLPGILGCIGAFMVGGTVKGVLGIGLPVVGLPLLLFSVDLKTAVGLFMVPLILSNVVQGLEGRGTLAVIRRFSVLLVCMIIGIVIGTALLATLDRSVLLLSVGAFVIVLTSATALQPSVVIAPSVERWLGPPVGLVSGVVGGMSTLIGPILAVYVVGLGIQRDMFVKTMSLIYTIGSLTLLAGNLAHGTVNGPILILSALAMIPVYGGMLIGRAIRKRTDPKVFRALVLAAIWFAGANMIRQGLGY